MLEWITAIELEGWTTIFTGMGAIVALVAAVLVIPQLRAAIRSLRLEGTIRFLDELERGKELRAYVYNELPTDPKLIAQLSYEDRQKVEEVIDAFNRIGLLIENRLVDKRLAFSIAHSVFIRLWFKLKPYADFWQTQIGGRYARRLERLDRRAKIFHDCFPQHRKTSLTLKSTQSPDPIVVYQTRMTKGVGGVIQRLGWLWRRIFGVY